MGQVEQLCPRPSLRYDPSVHANLSGVHYAVDGTPVRVLEPISSSLPPRIEGVKDTLMEFGEPHFVASHCTEAQRMFNLCAQLGLDRTTSGLSHTFFCC